MSDSAPTLSGWETYQDRSLSYLEPCPSHSSYQYSEREAELELGPDQDQYDVKHFLPERDHRYLPSRQGERGRVWGESGSNPHHPPHHPPHHHHHHHHHHHASSPDLLHQPLPAPSRSSLLSPYTNYHDYHHYQDYHGSFPELNQHQIIQSHRY